AGRCGQARRRDCRQLRHWRIQHASGILQHRNHGQGAGIRAGDFVSPVETLGHVPAKSAEPGLIRSRKDWLIFGSLLIVTVTVAPLVLSDFRLNLLGKFLALAILAVGIDLIWGYTGILSLGHGVFFGLGGYCMAMYLKLQVGTAGTYMSDLPDFMTWNGLTELPWFWKPMYHFWAAMLAAIGIPALFAMNADSGKHRRPE